ncbi:MAG: zf-HC2 domain-containing protein [candidate division Zixibacteria bacterium]
MENDYSKYSEKLSAYLDGELSPREMAEIVAALEKDKRLADEFDRLVKLKELATQSLPEFEDEILDNLENSIMSNLEDKPSRKASQEQHAAKIIPVWRKYLAVAATIAVFFLAGRIAYQEYGTDILSPARYKIRYDRDLKSAPDIDSSAISGQRSDDTAIENEKSLSPEESQKTSGRDEPIPEESTEKIEGEGAEAKSPVSETLIVQIDEQDYLPDIKEADKIMPQETDKKDEFVAVQLARPQLIQPEIKTDAVSMPGIEKRKGERLFAAEDLKSEYAIASVDSLDQFFNNYSPQKIRSKKSAGEIEMLSQTFTDVSLNEPVMRFLDSLRALPEFDLASKNIENHYLKILAARELYQITGEKQYFDDAIDNLKSLKKLIDSQLVLYPENKNLLEYKDRLSNFDLIE